MELYALRAHELRELLDKGEISSVELTKSLLARIESVDKAIGGYVTVRAEEALKEAEEADRRIRERRDVQPLTGIPVSLKDNICTEGTADDLRFPRCSGVLSRPTTPPSQPASRP